MSVGFQVLSDSDTHSIIKTLTGWPSAGSFTNKQFLEFLEEIWCIGAHLGIYIPYPNEIDTMKELEKIVELLKNEVFPAVEYIDTPLFLPIDKETKLTIRKQTINLDSHFFTDDHLELVISKGDPLITTRLFFEGKHLPIITEGINKIIETIIKPIMSKDHKRQVITSKIKELEQELTEIENE
ncbi:hypothetical protein GCM10017764_17950 [Sphingobacterium griseoflavum]|uniref:Uncharacterized protein n=2 Tax=Sphingobacterium griseoflavum TaxID=1474952 RepID=A0ABQ3HY92_9SPHI|nr:hypothetical protein GCM10017764_17950 [Sphingobacterium griseoflavum]